MNNPNPAPISGLSPVDPRVQPDSPLSGEVERGGNSLDTSGAQGPCWRCNGEGCIQEGSPEAWNYTDCPECGGKPFREGDVVGRLQAAHTALTRRGGDYPPSREERAEIARTVEMATAALSPLGARDRDATIAYISETIRLLIDSKKVRGPLASRLVTCGWRLKELAAPTKATSSGSTPTVVEAE